MQRQLARYGQEVSRIATESDSTEDSLEYAERGLLQISHRTGTHRVEPFGVLAEEGYQEYLQRQEQPTSEAGIQTGFGKLDRLLVELAPGSLTLIAARPSMGKTSLALNMATQIAEIGQKNVMVFSLEMTADQLRDRIIASYVGTSVWKMKKGELTEGEIKQWKEQLPRFNAFQLFLDDDPDHTIANIRSKARRHQLEHGLDILFVDYVGLVDVPDKVAGENRTREVTYISKSLKNLARELDVPIVALSQLSRALENRPDKRPVLSDLRDSGALEQDSDAVLMLFRKGYYEEDCDEPQITDVYLRKNRNGPTGQVELYFDPERMRFSELDREHS